MNNKLFWKKISIISFYSSVLLLIADTFFFEGVGFYSILTIIEVISLITLSVSSLMLFLIKRKGYEKI